ncbi:MAG: hypothetical protein M1833_005848 [Piccolia ochrophora]|nr:MAG: hypothetical protein M1833_005848 [Piccolia ochrophora]
MADGEGDPGGAADIAQLLKDLARGEQTATALENNLSSLERKIDDLLADVDGQANGPPNESKIGSQNLPEEHIIQSGDEPTSKASRESKPEKEGPETRHSS